MEKKVQTALPRWRGFNLMELYTLKSDGNFSEDDFRWISDWGFNFVRIPMNYKLWVKGEDMYDMCEPTIEKMDRVVNLGEKYGIHVSLNFHRAPGYCVHRGVVEPFNLWKDAEALNVFCYHWAALAKRYKGISSEKLSFDLVNEPPAVSEDVMTIDDYVRVTKAAAKGIRDIDPSRLIITEGTYKGNEPCFELDDPTIAQSCRAYIPMGVSHYKARWVEGADTLPAPTWPGAVHHREVLNVKAKAGDLWDRELLEEHYAKWASLASKGIGVHCGEGGAYTETPHEVVLAWLRDVLDILTGCNIGYSLWNLRSGFGILDTNRKDVDYEDWYGHKLDRKFLNLLQQF